MEIKKISNSQVKQSDVAESAEHKELWAVAAYLTKIKFSTCLIGVDEADVWKKIEKLCELYEDVLLAERCKNERLMERVRMLERFQEASEEMEDE